MVFLVNRVEGLVVHYGAATEPACRIGWPPLRPMFASQAATALYEALRLLRLSDCPFEEGDPRPNSIHAGRLWDVWLAARKAIADYEEVQG